MKSLAKIVAMGLVMSSVPVMGAWAKDLEVTRRDQCSDPKKLDFYYAAEFRICCVFFMQQN